MSAGDIWCRHGRWANVCSECSTKMMLGPGILYEKPAPEWKLNLADLSGPQETVVTATCGECKKEGVLGRAVIAPGESMKLTAPDGWTIVPVPESATPTAVWRCRECSKDKEEA